MNATQFKKEFIEDITYGILSVGVSIEDCFYHTLLDSDLDILKASAQVRSENHKEYKILFRLENEYDVIIKALTDAYDNYKHIIIFCNGENEDMDDYIELSSRLYDFIRQTVKDYL